MGFFDFAKAALPVGGGLIGGLLGGPAGGAVGSVVGGSAAGLFGSDGDPNAAANERNIALQKEFAQHGIRWKVSDAVQAGLHPLAALGAQTHSFSPSVVADSRESKWESLSRMGQDVTRAIASTRTQEEQVLAKLAVANAQADLEGRTIDNQIKATQLGKMQAVGSGPPSPGSTNFIPGQNDSGLMKTKPSERSSLQPGRPAQQAGWVPDVGFARTDTGLVPVPSSDVKERIEDQFVPEMMWAARNYLVPNLTGMGAPPKNMLPVGADRWIWNRMKQEWQPSKGPAKSSFESPRDTSNYLNKLLRERR